MESIHQDALNIPLARPEVLMALQPFPGSHGIDRPCARWRGLHVLTSSARVAASTGWLLKLAVWSQQLRASVLPDTGNCQGIWIGQELLQAAFQRQVLAMRPCMPCRSAEVASQRKTAVGYGPHCCKVVGCWGWD